MRDLTSSSGLGGGGGSVVLSILRSRAFFFPELVFAFFPMVGGGVYGGVTLRVRSGSFLAFGQEV